MSLHCCVALCIYFHDCSFFQPCKFLVEAIFAKQMTVLESKHIILQELKTQCDMEMPLERWVLEGIMLSQLCLRVVDLHLWRFYDDDKLTEWITSISQVPITEKVVEESRDRVWWWPEIRREYTDNDQLGNIHGKIGWFVLSCFSNVDKYARSYDIQVESRAVLLHILFCFRTWEIRKTNSAVFICEKVVAIQVSSGHVSGNHPWQQWCSSTERKGVPYYFIISLFNLNYQQVKHVVIVNE